jgi:hypothetical protein
MLKDSVENNIPYLYKKLSTSYIIELIQICIKMGNKDYLYIVTGL